jgi:hypothetical protein
MTKESFIAAFISRAPVGRKGWQARAAAEAAAAWEEKVATEAHAAACARAERLNAAYERELATPEWRVVEEWGSHSFANQLYRARAVFGGGNLTFAEAHARASEISASPRCRKAWEVWEACLNR